VVCGAAASGNYVWNDPKDIAMLLTCCMMSGPFLTGYTQTINDYYDREIDAINEPYRPIPSGEGATCWSAWLAERRRDRLTVRRNRAPLAAVGPAAG
jgi:4-hydroxybenzoate polyprenyltransferase